MIVKSPKVQPRSRTVVVGIGNLRVLVVKREGYWFARGIDINYAAQGRTLSEVKRNFATGLRLTIDEHLKEFGDLQFLRSPSPFPSWSKLIFDSSRKFRFSQVSVHKLPNRLQDILKFGGISFIRPELDDAAA